MGETEIPPKKLLVIAVEVDDGTIKEPDPSDPHPRVVGIVDSNIFDAFVQDLLNAQPPKAERPTKANHGTGKHPYVDSAAPLPKHVATILHTHHSPGCTWVTVNGWPFCY
jgi:hypothetical protein